VHDDEIERAEGLRVEIEDVSLAQLDIVQAHCVDQGLTGGDLVGVQIDADAATLRQVERQRNQVATAGAAELEDAARRRIRRRQAEQVAESIEPLRWLSGTGRLS